MLECITSPKKPRLTFFKLIPVLTSCGLSRLKRCEDGASAIHSVKKRRTDQVWRAAFNPQRLSCDSDIRLIKMSEAIHLINGRDKTLPMFSSRGDLEAIHAFLGKRPAARLSCTNECVYAVCICTQPYLDLWMSQMVWGAHSSSSSECNVNAEIWRLKSNSHCNTMSGC